MSELPRINRRRRIALGLGRSDIHDRVLTLKTRSSRDVELETVLLVGDGMLSEVRIDGVPITDGFPGVKVAANAVIEIDVTPTTPRPPPPFPLKQALRWHRFHRMQRVLRWSLAVSGRPVGTVAAALKGFIE